MKYLAARCHGKQRRKGNILGLLNGENAIPLNWRKNLKEYALISQIADDLYTRCEENADGEVTEDWWEKYPGF